MKLADSAKLPAPYPLGIPGQKRLSVGFQASAALGCYLEGNLPECRARARDTVALAMDFFFGEWRTGVPNPKGEGPYPAEEWLTLPWVEEYRDAIFWSACLNDWESARSLSQYPSERTVDRVSERKSEAPWYQLLAAYLRGDVGNDDLEITGDLDGATSAKAGSFERLIEEGRSRRVKLLRDALSAIASRNPTAARDGIAQYLAYYRKNEFPRPDLDDKVALDGSILVHLAERAGLDVDIPSIYSDHVVWLVP